MHMMVLGAGGRRTEAEHHELLATAEFTVTRIILTSVLTRVTEAVPLYLLSAPLTIPLVQRFVSS